MSKNPSNRQERRKKAQKKAVLLIILLALCVTAFAFFVYRDNLFTGNFQDKPLYGPRGDEYSNLQGEISRFFTDVRRSMWSGRTKKKSIIDLEPNPRPLINILDELARYESNPVALTWRGSVKSRWFMADDTLKTNAERIAAEENMELLWWLDKDYRVQAAFQVESDIVNTLDRIARSLNSHHPDQVQAYLCPQQRVLLIATSEGAQDVQHYCTPVQKLRR